MYLKRIETIGFKSFADKTIVEFEKGVTAVVGPNGSGKSNISDSIRWVLGEQSAKSLRGGKMEDIIFAGTSTRKPLNFAEVTLVLDNTCHSLPIDYDEVAITRRVYRTGDSEYLINKQKVRLKDVIDLIMDSGIGHDSLSIISQDKVKSIVEAKVEDRRVIIEEAAGVLKYKMRKKEATRKLASTKDNLDRVYDIIYELEDQLEPLRQQADKATQYNVFKKELDDSEIAVLAYDVKNLNDRLKDVEKMRQDLTVETLGLNAVITTGEAKMMTLKETQQIQEKELEELQNHLVETAELIQMLQGRRDVLIERYKNATSNKDELAQQLETLTARLQLLTVEQETSTAAVLELQMSIKTKQTRLNELNEAYYHLEENLKSELEQARRQYFEDLNEQSSIKNQYVTVNQQIKRIESSFERLTLEDVKAVEELQTLTQEFDGFLKTYAKLEDKLKTKREDYQQVNQDYHVQKKQLEAERVMNQKNGHQLDKLTQRLQWLEDAQKDFSGFNEGVKKILKAREQKQLNGIEGAVAELMVVPKELELALDVVLGASMQQIVTTSDDAAKAAIDYLKRNHAGRATFLPLNVIKSRLVGQDILARLKQETGVIGVASQLVTFDDRYRTIIENMLGNIIVATNLDVAKTLARKLNYRFRIVTLEGDVINAGGAMTGGAIKRQGSSLLRAKNEIDECQLKIKTLQAELATSETRQQELEVLVEQLERQLTKLQQTGETLKEKMAQANQEKLAFEYREKGIKERQRTSTRERQNLDREFKEFIQQNNELADRRIVLEESIEHMHQRVEQLEGQLETQEETKQQLMQEMTDLKVELARLETECQNKQTSLARLTEEFTTTTERVTSMQVRLNQNEELLSSNDDDVSSLEEEVEAQKGEREHIIETIQQKRLALATLTSEVETLEREVKESQKVYQRLSTQINQQDVSLGKMNLELDLMLKKLEEEHQMTFSYANEHYPLKQAADEVKQQIKGLKQKLSQLGDVNLGAIAEYERIKERFEFLSEQREDLLLAKDNLEQTIHEMDAEMTVKFKETFDLVRDEFTVIFKKLFGGGHADLQLTDPHDLLHTGVEIIAQPPGTKLRTSNLLSGGQKALTSIALLFAILKIRTVPFCVLDEVEAALDEANVARYANYLKVFSEQTQFIVITHRKGTMEKADVLYGVTMQERGVTKLVSVRMEHVNDYLDEK